ncbi:hypothetical protein [uncultured Helicobacter sp.]|uniref:hypothetical protein n=3 Tax=uncultured Helicobacter sp. TaxID=175537 RepID=UPI0025E98F04|nr:hypothetical protein [uncultured Helicobacter sp.]
MLIRNEIVENLQQKLQAEISKATFLIDDILILDINKSPFIVIRQTDTQISIPSSQSWKHTLGLEIEIIATSKSKSDELLESILLTLENFSGIKNITAIKVEKSEIATTQAFSVSIELEIIYFTPSFRA